MRLIGICKVVKLALVHVNWRIHLSFDVGALDPILRLTRKHQSRNHSPRILNQVLLALTICLKEAHWLA
jgi:hypothetical protein